MKKQQIRRVGRLHKTKPNWLAPTLPECKVPFLPRRYKVTPRLSRKMLENKLSQMAPKRNNFLEQGTMRRLRAYNCFGAKPNETFNCSDNYMLICFLIWGWRQIALDPVEFTALAAKGRSLPNVFFNIHPHRLFEICHMRSRILLKHCTWKRFLTKP